MNKTHEGKAMKPWAELLPDIDEALTDESAQKELEIETYVSKGEIFFEAKIPRHSENDLGMSKAWEAASPTEAAAFLRELADLIEKGRTADHE